MGIQLYYVRLEVRELCGLGTNTLCGPGTETLCGSNMGELCGSDMGALCRLDMGVDSTLHFNIFDLGLIKLFFTILKSVMNAQTIPSIAPINTSSEWCI